MPTKTTTEQRTPRTVSSLAAAGNRPLLEKSRVYEENAWDNAEWTDEQERDAAAKVAAQEAEASLTTAEREEIQARAPEHWDAFYAKHRAQFFRDRQWLRVEFPCIFETAQTKWTAGESFSILEVGCGAGNTAFPLLEELDATRKTVNSAEAPLRYIASDFSAAALELVRADERFPANADRLQTCQLDISKPELPEGAAAGSHDVILCIFVLSAVPPRAWPNVRANLRALLKPGGVVLFRDYGRFDMTQLRFKRHRVLGDNVYVRGDGTLVHFFTREQVERELFPGFEVLQCGVDRRLLVNRSRQLQMYRVWIQGQFQLLPDHCSC